MVLIVVRVFSFFLGVYLIISTILSTLQTFVLPRASNTRIARFAFTMTRRVLDTFVPRAVHTLSVTARWRCWRR